MKDQRNTICFSSRGQVVIPRRFRRELGIEDGTRAVVTLTPEGILLKPITAAMIGRGFGLLKPKSGGPSFAEEWAAHMQEEKALEETKSVRRRS